MLAECSVSVIIPTYNRCESLRMTLDSLAKQTCPQEQFEVVVVDDGSTDSTGEIANDFFPFRLQYLRQENQGGIVARNHGVENARHELLIFLDDDMTLMPGYVMALSQAHKEIPKLVSRGTLLLWLENCSPFARINSQTDQENSSFIGDFASNNLAILREDFFSLGGWRQVIVADCGHRGGLWADLEFAHRALQNGFEFKTIPGAQIIHRDYAIENLQAASQRAFLISECATPFFREYSDLWLYTPMFHNKAPIAWRSDTARLIARKLLRQAASTRPILWGLEKLAIVLERAFPQSSLLRPLYRLVMGGYIFRGYRQGLKRYTVTSSTKNQ